jgi:hypothetical protein
MQRHVSWMAGFAAAALLLSPALASTNPDTPTNMTSNIINGTMHQDGHYTPHYFTFQAGPGSVKLRLTIRPNGDDEEVDVKLTDQDGKEYASMGWLAIVSDDIVKTKEISVPARTTLVLQIAGKNAVMSKTAKPTFRIQLDGDVNLNKTTKPMEV